MTTFLAIALNQTIASNIGTRIDTDYTHQGLANFFQHLIRDLRIGEDLLHIVQFLQGIL
jgi:hypothetical protein